MKYYRVKKEYDNKTRYTWNNKHQGVSNGILVANELYTPSEFRKIANCKSWFEEVEVNKNKTHWFFGARFADDFSYSDFARVKYNY